MRYWSAWMVHSETNLLRGVENRKTSTKLSRVVVGGQVGVENRKTSTKLSRVAAGGRVGGGGGEGKNLPRNSTELLLRGRAGGWWRGSPPSLQHPLCRRSYFCARSNLFAPMQPPLPEIHGVGAFPNKKYRLRGMNQPTTRR